MADDLRIIIKSQLDESTQHINSLNKQIQNIANKLNKIKLGIDIDTTNLKQVTKQMKTVQQQVINSTNVKTGSDAELYIKLWKAQEQAIARARKAEELQQKAIAKANQEREKALQYEQKVRKAIEQSIKKEQEKTRQIQTQVNLQLESLRTRAQLLKQNYGFADFTELDKFINSLDVDKIDLSNYKKQLAEIKNEYQLIAQRVQESHKNNQVNLQKEIELENQKNAALMKNWVKQLEIDAQQRKIASDKIKEQMKLEALNQKQIEQEKRKNEQLEIQLNKIKERAKADVEIVKIYGNKEQIQIAQQLNDQIQKTSTLTGEAGVNVRKFSDNLREMARQTKTTAKSTMSLKEMVLTAVKAFSVWISVTQVVMTAIRGVRDGIRSIVELDTSLTELSKVSNITTAELKKFTTQAYEVGEAIGRTGKEVIDATTEWVRAGYSIQEALELSEKTLLFTNIADGIDDVTEASSALIAVLKGFKMEASEVSHVIDVLNEISNNFAVNTDDLTEILRRVSGTLAQTGTSFEELTAMSMAAYESLRSAEMVASGLNMISQRLRGMSEAGEEIEGLVPKIQEAFDKYTDGAVQIIDEQNGGLKSTYEILKQLHTVYGDLSDEAKAYLNELIAGNRQNKVLVAIMENWENVEKAIESANNAFGSATRENEKYLNSIQGKINQFNSAVQQMWFNTIDSDVIKFFVDLGTGIVNIVDKIGLLNTVILVTVGYLSIIKGMSLTNIIQGIIDIVVSLTKKVATLNVTLASFKTLGIIALIMGLVKVFQELYVSVDEHKQQVEELANEYNSLQNQLEKLKSIDNPTQEQSEYISLLERELEIKQELLRIEQKRLMEKDVFGKGVWGKGLSKEIKENLDSIEMFKSAIETTQADLQHIMNTWTDEELKKYSDDDRLLEHLKNLKEQTLELERSLIEQRKTLQGYADALGDEVPKELQELINDIDNALPQLQQMNGTLNKTNESANNAADGINNIGQATQRTKEEQEELNKAFNDSIESFQDVTDKIQSLHKIQNELNESNKLSADTIDEIISKHPELIGYLGDREALENKISEAIGNQEKVQAQAYNNMLENSQTYFNEQIRGNTELFNKLKIAYGKDAENFKTLAEAKDATDKLLVRIIGNRWSDLYGSQEEALQAIIDMAPRAAKMAMNEQERNRIYADAAEARKQLDAIRAIKRQMDITIKDIDFKTINLDPISSGSSGSSSKTAKEIYQPIIDRYYEINNAIKQVNNALEENSLALEQVDDANKIGLLKERVKLYEQQKKNLEELNRIQKDVLEAYRQELSAKGFTFDDLGNITNYSDQLPKFEGDEAKAVEELIDKYTELYTDAIPSTSNEIQQLTIDIISANDEISNIIQSQIDELNELNDDLEETQSQIADLEEQLAQAQFDNKINKIQLGVSAFSNEISLLQEKLDLLYEDDFEGRIEVVAELFEASKKQTRELQDEFERLASITPRNADEADKLAAAMENIQQQMRQSYQNTLEYQRALDNLRLNSIVQSFEDANSALERELNLINHNISQLQEGILPDLSTDMFLPIPDMTGMFIDLRSEAEKQYDEQVEIEEKIQDLKRESLRLQLEEAEKFYQEEMNKMMAHYNELVAKISEQLRTIETVKAESNDEQLKQIDELYQDINKTITQNNEEVKQIIAQNNEQLNQQQSEQYDIYLNNLQEQLFNQEINSLNTHYETVINTITTFLFDIQEKYSSAWQSIVSIVQNSVDKINSAIASVRSMPSMPSGNQVEQYAKGTKYHEGGIALTGEEGEELAILPSGKAVLLGKNGAELVDLPRGTQVIPNEETEEILKHTGNIDGKQIPKYADGTDYVITFTSGFANIYSEYIRQRQQILDEIARDQELILKGLVVNIEEFREELLDKIDEQLAKDIIIQSEAKLNILKQQQSNFQEYLYRLQDEYNDAIQKGNLDLAKDLAEQYNESLQESLQLTEQINRAIKERYEAEFELIDKKIAKENQMQGIYKKQIEILKELDAYNYDGFIQYNEAILQSEMKKLDVLKQSSEELQKQLELLAVGSNEWNIVNDRLEKINGSILDVTLAIIRQNKEILRNKYDRELKNLENSIFGGMTLDEAREQLDDKINAQNEYVDGLEKELLIAKLLSNARKNDVALTAEELNMLNQAGKIERDKLDRLEKQLAIRILEQRIENLKNQKTIRQLAKKADGTWDYTYVADQDAIEKAEEELKDAKLDLIKFDQEVLNKQQREEFNQKVKHFNKLKDSLDKSLRAEYETKEAFYSDLQDLVGKFLDFLDVDVSDSMERLLESFDKFLEKIGALSEGLNKAKVPSGGSSGGEYDPNAWVDEYDGSHIDRSKFGFLYDYDFIQVGNTGYNMDAVRDDPKLMEKVMKDIDRHNGYYIVDADNDNFAEQVHNAYTGEIIDINDLAILDEKGRKKPWVRKGGFASGGETQTTGWHWLDGKMGKPERVLSAEQNANFNKLISSIPDMLKNIDILNNITNRVSRIPNLNNLNLATQQSDKRDIVFNISKLEFPNVHNAKDIENAIMNLPRIARMKVRTTPSTP